MHLFLTFAFLFYLGSTVGWVLELFFRRIFTAKRWLNPGFLVGPSLPLYGFGLCLLYLVSCISFDFLPDSIWKELLRILVMGLALTAVEYLAGKIFVVTLQVKLWDYSNRFGNIEGIICPLFSFFWAILGGAYFYFLHPHIVGAVSWLFSNLAFSFFIGLYFGVLLVDFGYSLRLVSQIRKFAKENHLVVKWEELKKQIRERIRGVKFIHFLFPIPLNSVVENMSHYRLKWEERLSEVRKKSKGISKK